MPLYFGSDNKIYDSDLDGSTSYAGNTADYKPIDSYEHSNILKFYSKNNNKKLSFDNSTTSGFLVSRKNYVFGDKNEKVYHFTNLVDNYINKKITLLNYNPNTLETHLNSSNQGWTSDVIAIMKWKGNLENKRDQVVQDFVSGITDGLPLLEDFVKTDGATSFSSLRFYRGGNFSRFSPRTNREIELMSSVINEGSTGCPQCDQPTIQPIETEPPINTVISGSYDYCIPSDYSFPQEMFTDLNSMSQEEFGVKYFRGGTTESLGCPVFKMEKNESGTTSDVYLALTPADIKDQSQGISATEFTFGGNLEDFYNDIKEKTGLANGCMSFGEGLSSQLYDPVTNPCGIVSYGCLCDSGFKFDGKVRRKQYDDTPNDRRNFEPCGEDDLEIRPAFASIDTKPNLGVDLYVEPELLWEDTDELQGRDFDSTFDGWKSPDYPGALSRCRASGTPGTGEPFWHGLTSSRFCENCLGEYACLNVASYTQSFYYEYKGTICKTTSIPYNPEYPFGPTRVIDCIDFLFVISNFIQSVCSYETSCECGCNPTCCLCVCAGNHENNPDFENYPSCTGGTCDYQSREIDVVRPEVNTDISIIIDESI